MEDEEQFLQSDSALEQASKETQPRQRWRAVGLVAVAGLAAFAVQTRAQVKALPPAPAVPPEEEYSQPHPIDGDVLPGLVGLNSVADVCGPCVPSCPAMALALKNYKVQSIYKAPAEYNLATSFYKKYINVMGIPVISSDKVCDCTLQKAAWLAHGVLSHIKLRPAVVAKMKLQKSRLVVMAKSEKTTDVPEHAHLRPKEMWDRRARGLGATKWAPASSVGEENVMCEPWSTNPYFGENILVHEFLHGIARTGLDLLQWDGMDWDDFNAAVYEKSRKAGRWESTYAAENRIEFFAEIAQSFWSANLQAGCCDSQADCSNGIHNCVNTRAELKEYDPDAYAHLLRIFEETDWRPGTGTDCGCENSEAALTIGYVALNEDGDVAIPTCHGNAGSQPCHMPFVWNGKKHHTCIRDTSRSSRRWCGANEDATLWGECECDGTLPDDAPVGPKTPTCEGNANGDYCQFPFTYNGKKYHQCTRDDHNALWCGTNGDSSRWGHCECHPVVTTCGGSAEGAPCHFPFKFDGQEFTECTKHGFHTYWCGTDYDTSKWGVCGCSESDDEEEKLPTSACHEFSSRDVCDTEEMCQMISGNCEPICHRATANYACQSLGGCAWNSDTSKCYHCVDTHDLHGSCASWSKQGYCDGVTSGYMKTNCPRACGQDADRSSHCPYWAKQGECETNPGYMLDACGSSCSCDAL